MNISPAVTDLLQRFLS